MREPSLSSSQDVHGDATHLGYVILDKVPDGSLLCVGLVRLLLKHWLEPGVVGCPASFDLELRVGGLLVQCVPGTGCERPSH